MEMRRKTHHVLQGEFKISNDPDEELATVLGSCISACIYDPFCKIGGMNHFLLPGTDPESGENIKYGVHAMEQLINSLLRAGAERHNLQVHLYGGANVVEGLSGIGESNATFARKFVRDEQLMLANEDTGGNSGRRITFHPTSGDVRLQMVQTDDEPIYQRPKRFTKAPTLGQVELF